MGVAWAEWRWALLWSLLILALTSLPYIVAAQQATDDYHFGGLVYDVGDIYTYLAEMRQGAAGNWLLHLPFTSEDHRRALIHPLYLLLGKAGHLLRLAPLATYHLARLGAGLALLLMAYAFFAHFTPHCAQRRLAFLFTGLSSGLGWLILVFGGDQWLGDIAIDFWVPEAFTLPILYGFPHISLSVALLLLALLCYLRACATNAVERSNDFSRSRHASERLKSLLRIDGWAVASGVAALLLVFLVPFDIAIVWSAIAAHIVGLWIRKRRFPVAPARAGLAVGLISAPGLAYNLWVFAFNPAFREWARQNPGFSPHPLHWMLSLAFLGGLALAGAWRVVRRGHDDWLLLAGWVFVDLVLVYLPFNLQRRLIVGLHPALCLLATVGLTQAIAPALLGWRPLSRALQQSRRYSRRGLRRLAVYAALCFTLPSNLLLLAGPIVQAPAHAEPMYQTPDKVAAVAWLAGNTAARDVVLCTVEEGNYIPAHADNWVYLGHGAITGEYDRKAAEVEAFFAGRLSTDDMADFLWRNRIAYIYFGPRERALGPLDPAQYSFLREVYANATVQIYRVAAGTM